jgi:protoporphyrinogen oxidase
MKICIIGGGITGLSAGYKLSKLGHNVSIFESGSFLGGQASTIKFDDFEIEKAYHHLFKTDKSILDLYKDLKINDELNWYKSSVATYSEGKIWKTTSPFDLLRLSLIPLTERIKLFLISIRLKLLRNWQKIENETAFEWLSKRVNNKTFNVIFKPLLKGKFGRYYNKIPMPWFWSKVQTRVSSRNYKLQEVLCYPKNSFSNLIQTLEKEIKNNGGKIYLNTKVTEIIKKCNKVESVNIKDIGSMDSNIKFDIVISTVPYSILGKLIELEDSLKKDMNEIDYMSAIVMILILENKVSDYYWLSIADNDFPFLGLIEHTNLIPKELYKNQNILYITNYVETDNPLLNLSYDEILDLYLPFMKKINNKFSKEWIKDFRFSKIDFAQPIIPTNYSSKIIPLRLPIKGLYSGNTSQIYPEDRGTNYSVDMADKIIRLIELDN